MDPPAPVIRIFFLLTPGPKKFLFDLTLSRPKRSSISIGFNESILVFPLAKSSNDGISKTFIFKRLKKVTISLFFCRVKEGIASSTSSKGNFCLS